MRIPGTKTDGSAFSFAATAVTKRVDLFSERDIATIGLAGLAKAARKLASFQTNFSDAIAWRDLDELARCPALRDLSLSADGATDLRALANAPALAHLHLAVHGATTLDLGWLKSLPALTSLGLSCHGKHPAIDLAQIPALESLSLSGVGNIKIDIAHVSGGVTVEECEALAELSVDTAHHRHLDIRMCSKLHSLTLTDVKALEHFNLDRVPALTRFDLGVLAGAPLKTIRVVEHGIRALDLTPFAHNDDLYRVDFDGKELLLGKSVKVRNRAIRQLQAGDRITMV